MNNKMKKLAAAVLAVAGLSGCTSMQVADLARTDAKPAQAEEAKVIRPLQSSSVSTDSGSASPT